MTLQTKNKIKLWAAWILIVLFPPALLWTILHEAAHCVIPLLKGGKITKFKVLPHIDEKDVFRMGRMHWDAPLDQAETMASQLAPYWLVDLPALFLFAFISCFIIFDAPIAASVLIGLTVLPIVNSFNALRGIFFKDIKTDFSKSPALKEETNGIKQLFALFTIYAEWQILLFLPFIIVLLVLILLLAVL